MLYIINICFLLSVILPQTQGSAGFSDFGSSVVDDTITVSRSEETFLIINTPVYEEYDDGMLRKVFTGYVLYDSKNNLTIRVSDSPFKPVKLRILPGNYSVMLYSNRVYRFTVKSGLTETFYLPE